MDAQPELQIEVDASTGIVTVTSKHPLELTTKVVRIPFMAITACYHAILGHQLAMAAAQHGNGVTPATADDLNTLNGLHRRKAKGAMTKT